MIFITSLIDKKNYILILINILNIFFLVYLYYYQKKIILKMLFLVVVDNYTPISLFLSFSHSSIPCFIDHCLSNHNKVTSLYTFLFHFTSSFTTTTYAYFHLKLHNFFTFSITLFILFASIKIFNSILCKFTLFMHF